ncbi:MAG: DMT family transporter [Hyphomicrobiales bacterium]|nr:DMT family transporter [Hyphomicrobiales bacterium]MBV9520807.1 DMT family transporter [Hyphomicrobiales bacterium]
MPVLVLAFLSFPPMAAQFAATKFGVQAGLTAWDIAAFRYGAAALGSLLVLANPTRRAIMLAMPGRFLIVGLLGGAFYGAIFTAATTMMPASHSTLFAPSSSILCTLLVAGVVLGAWPSPTRLIGVGIILAGLVVFARAADVQIDAEALGGDALFGLIGLLWGCFSVFARKWNLDPLCCVAAMGATGLLFVPLWFFFAPSNVTGANLAVALGEGIFQGWFLTFVAFLAYMKLVHRLGPPTAALGIALIPPMGVAIATLVLHETTYPGQWLGAAIVVAGLAIAGGAGAGPLGRVVGLRPVQ